MYINALPSSIPIGKQGENHATTVEIDVAAWVDEYPGLTVAISMTTPQDSTAASPFLVSGVTLSGDTLTWVVGNDATQYSGLGTIVVRGLLDGTEVRSTRTMVQIDIGHAAAGDAPEDIADYLTEAAEAEAERRTAETARGTAETGRAESEEARRQAEQEREQHATQAINAANTAAGAANTSAANADAKAGLANTAASAANTVAMKLSAVEAEITMTAPNTDPVASVEQTSSKTTFSFYMPWARVAYPVFSVDPDTHHLAMELPDEFGANFQINNGHLEVVV